MNSDCYYMSSWIREKSKLFFVPININLFIAYDLKTKETMAMIIEREEFLQDNLYAKCIKYKNKAIFIPLHAKHFLMVDLKSFEMNFFDIPKTNNYSPPYGRFSGGFIHGQCLYAVGYLYSGLIEFNLETKKMRIVEAWANFVRDNLVSYTFGINSKMEVAVALKSGEIVRYNIRADKVDSKKILGYQFEGITSCGSIFWMLDNDKKCLVKWNTESNQISEIQLNGQISFFERGIYRYIEYINEKVIMIPDNNNPLLIYNVNDHKISKLWIDEEKRIGFSALAVFVEDDFIYISDKTKKTVFIINSIGLSVSKFSIPIDTKLAMETIALIKNIAIKEDVVGLDDYIGYVIQ